MELSQRTQTHHVRDGGIDGTELNGRNKNPADPKKPIFLSKKSDQCQRYAKCWRIPVSITWCAAPIRSVLSPATAGPISPAAATSWPHYIIASVFSFTHVPHQGTSAMISFPLLHFVIFISLYVFCFFSLFIIIILFSGERSFTGLVIDSLRRKCALFRDYQNAIAREKMMPHRLATSSGSPSIILVNPHGIAAVVVV